MIRFRVKELVAKREYALGRRLTMGEVAESAGMHRMTLSKMANQSGYNTSTDNLNRLCRYFGCPVEALVEFVPEEGMEDGR